MLKRLFANLLDQMVVFGVSVGVFFLTQAIMKGFGFQMVASTEAYFLIIFYGVLNLIYYPIFEGTKYGTTIGKRILKLDEK
ncbi:MAG: RDD family protein [Clostridium sp.]|nr:RDD family protein [Clostridium sp.]